MNRLPGADGHVPSRRRGRAGRRRAPRTLDFEGGHGTFIAGVIAQLCPDAEVHTSGVLSSFGDGDVADVIAGARAGLGHSRAADRHRRDELRRASSPTTIRGSSATSLRRCSAASSVVAAAGNQATCRPYFPAGLHDVIGVGAGRRPVAGVVLELRRLGRCLRPGRRRRQHVLQLQRGPRRSPTLDDLKPRQFKRVGALERDELLGAEGRRGRRPGDVPQSRRDGSELIRPTRRGGA